MLGLVTLTYRLLTPPAPGAIALIELEGAGAKAVLERAFRARLPRPGRAAVGELVDESGAPLDELVITCEEAPGAERFTLAAHGGLGVVSALQRFLGRAGAALRPDPRSQGLSQAAGRRCEAEAEALLPEARTALACQVLLRQLQGALRAEVERLAASPSAPELARLLLSAQLGRRLTEPARVALWGAPNAGKSSLLNALVGRERVLVADLPGTTRDAIEVELSLDGLPVSLVDTAGQRQCSDPLEAEGIALARDEGRRADLRLVVVDGTDPGSAPQAPAPAVVAWNKRDLVGWSAPPSGAVATSLAGPEPSGISQLRAALRRALLGAASEVSGEGAVLFTPRQAGLVAGALGALERGDPQRASRCLGAILG